MTLAHAILDKTAAPVLVFGAAPEHDAADTLDLREMDVPTSDVELRNNVRLCWRRSPRLVVRIDDEPTAQVEALLLELVRREVRLSADQVESFGADRQIVVRGAAQRPPPRLLRWFPARLRDPDDATTPPMKAGRANARRR
jgi:hypothetical protein